MPHGPAYAAKTVAGTGKPNHAPIERNAVLETHVVNGSAYHDAAQAHRTRGDNTGDGLFSDGRDRVGPLPGSPDLDTQCCGSGIPRFRSDVHCALTARRRAVVATGRRPAQSRRQAQPALRHDAGRSAAVWLARSEIPAAEQHQIVACPGQRDTATDIERVFHRVAHAERVLNGVELVRGKTAAQFGRHASQKPGDEGVAGGAGRRRQLFGNL